MDACEECGGWGGQHEVGCTLDDQNADVEDEIEEDDEGGGW